MAICTLRQASQTAPAVKFLTVRCRRPLGSATADAIRRLTRPAVRIAKRYETVRNGCRTLDTSRLPFRHFGPRPNIDLSTELSTPFSESSSSTDGVSDGPHIDPSENFIAVRCKGILRRARGRGQLFDLTFINIG